MAIVFSFKCLLIHSSIDRCPIPPHVLFTTKISSSSWLTDKTASQTYFLILHSLEQLLKYSMAIECGPWSFKLNTAYTLLLNGMITSSLKFFYNVSSQINFWLKLKHLSIILFLYLYQHFRVRKLQVYWPLFLYHHKDIFFKRSILLQVDDCT